MPFCGKYTDAKILDSTRYPRPGIKGIINGMIKLPPALQKIDVTAYKIAGIAILCAYYLLPTNNNLRTKNVTRKTGKTVSFHCT
jgi:hypothetical protein